MGGTDTQPDHHTVVTQLTAEIGERHGPLWDRINPLPDHVLYALTEQIHSFSALVTVDTVAYLVYPNGQIRYAYDKEKSLEPMLDEEEF